MKNLVAEGWLEKSRKGNFSLTPRALMELRSWLRETYNYVNAEGQRVRKIKECAACKDIITVVRVVGIQFWHSRTWSTDEFAGTTLWKS